MPLLLQWILPALQQGLLRVNRGGSWRHDAWGCRMANRDYVGFRLVRTAE